MKPPEEEMRDALGRMADRLVELGYANKVLLEDTPKAITVFWTDSGRILQKELERMFPQVRNGKELNTLDTQMFLALFLTTNSGENPINRR
jgi:DNA-binding MarR family transcriptional regulator